MRVKRFKRKNGNVLEYAYLVQNKRNKRKKSVKQKVKAYLGRVYRIGKEGRDNKEFWETVDSDPETYLRLATKEKILNDVIRYELMRHGFVNMDGKWVKDELKIDIKKKKVIGKNNSKCVLAINEGYLCESNIKKLSNYEQKDDINKAGYELARLFIESGIDIPQEVFVEFYDKL